MNNMLVQYTVDESGQGITEYGAILAFVAVLVALVAGFSNGTLMTAVSECLSEISSAMSSMAASGDSGP